MQNLALPRVARSQNNGHQAGHTDHIFSREQYETTGEKNNKQKTGKTPQKYYLSDRVVTLTSKGSKYKIVLQSAAHEA